MRNLHSNVDVFKGASIAGALADEDISHSFFFLFFTFHGRRRCKTYRDKFETSRCILLTFLHYVHIQAHLHFSPTLNFQDGMR